MCFDCELLPSESQYEKIYIFYQCFGAKICVLLFAKVLDHFYINTFMITMAVVAYSAKKRKAKK